MTATDSGYVYPATSYTLGWRQGIQDLAESAETVLGNREIQTFQWADSAARAAQTGMVAGDLGYQADTDTYYRYTGSVWGLLATGLAVGSTQARGLSVSNTGTSASMDANGRVAFTACTVVTVWGLSADYDIYEFDLSSVGTAATMTINLTNASGSPNSGSVYDRTELTGRNGGASSSTSTAQTGWLIGGFANTTIQSSIKFAGLCAARATTGLSNYSVNANPMASSVTNGVKADSLLHRTATAYFGLRVTFSNAQTGSLRIRGVV